MGGNNERRWRSGSVCRKRVGRFTATSGRRRLRLNFSTCGQADGRYTASNLKPTLPRLGQLLPFVMPSKSLPDVRFTATKLKAALPRCGQQETFAELQKGRDQRRLPPCQPSFIGSCSPADVRLERQPHMVGLMTAYRHERHHPVTQSGKPPAGGISLTRSISPLLHGMTRSQIDVNRFPGKTHLLCLYKNHA